MTTASCPVCAFGPDHACVLEEFVGGRLPVLRMAPTRSRTRYQNGAPKPAAPMESSSPSTFNGTPQVPKAGSGALQPRGNPLLAKKVRAFSAHVAGSAPCGQ